MTPVAAATSMDLADRDKVARLLGLRVEEDNPCVESFPALQDA